MNEKKNNKKKVLILVLVLVLVLLTIGGTYAFFTYTRQGEQENTLKTGTMYFVYDEESENPDNRIQIKNAFPMSDEEGKDQEGEGQFEFEVRAQTQGAPINYEIYLTKEETSTLPDKSIRTYLTKEGVVVTPTSKTEEVNSYRDLAFSQLPILEGKEGKTLYQETISDATANYNKTFVFRMWLDENANTTRDGEWLYGGMNFSVKINVYASNDSLPAPKKLYQDGTGANIPDLVEGMIPIKYDGKKIVKADVTTEWYDYAKWNWANAVTVTEDQRDTLMSAPSGTEIQMDNINTMWVWIPRYEYDYTNIATVGTDKANPGAIGVKFLSGTSDSSTENYMLHPAFTFGTQELEGFWYGKFETSNKENTCDPSKQGNVDIECDLTTLTPQIKPGVTSWRGIRVSTAFQVAQSMNANEAYGFNKTSDVHMSKNDEWGAVVYLSQSTYGKQGNTNYTGANKEVYQNKSNDYITGSSNGTPSQSATKEGDQYAYDDLTDLQDGKGLAGPGASTTGTIYGVYDMSGGAWERVMNVLEDEDGMPRSGNNTQYNSGFSGKLNNGSYVTDGRPFPEIKYYSTYDNGSTYSNACDGEACLGEALSETAAWYGDYTTWLTSAIPWLGRGGFSGNDAGAGVFSFYHTYCQSYVDNSFRLVLTP